MVSYTYMIQEGGGTYLVPSNKYTFDAANRCGIGLRGTMRTRGPNMGTIERISRENGGRVWGPTGMDTAAARKTPRAARFSVASWTERYGGGVDEFWDLWKYWLVLWIHGLWGGMC
jgi:hypothetical protein